MSDSSSDEDVSGVTSRHQRDTYHSVTSSEGFQQTHMVAPPVQAEDDENDVTSSDIQQADLDNEPLDLLLSEQLDVHASVDASAEGTVSVRPRDQSSRLPPRNQRPGFADEGDDESQQMGEQLMSTRPFPEWERTLERPSSPHPPGLHPESVMSFNDWIKTVERSDIKVSIRDVPKPFGINLDE